MIDIKQELKGIGYGTIYIIVFLSIIYYFKLELLEIYLFCCGIALVSTIYKKDTIKNFINSIFYISLIFGIVYLFGGYGLIGYFATSILIAAFILYKRRHKYFMVKHHMENMIFGKPLYKFKEKNKKPPKIKISL